MLAEALVRIRDLGGSFEEVDVEMKRRDEGVSSAARFRTMIVTLAGLLLMGLTAWAAFSFPLMMVNWSYIQATASDPMGWGWNLLGTADFAWEPLFPESMVYIQLPLLLIGLVFSLKRGYAIAYSLWHDRKSATLSLVPPALVCTAIVMSFVTLFAG